MPTPNTSLPTFTATVAGVEIASPRYFTEGATLDAATAEWANKRLTSDVGNAIANWKRRNDAKPASEQEAFDAQVMFNTSYAEYDFSGNRGSGAPKVGADPVARLVRELATAEVKAKIVAKKLRVKDFMDAKVTHDGTEMSKLQSLILQFTAANLDSLTARAEAALDTTSETSTDDLDLSLTSPTPEAEAA